MYIDIYLDVKNVRSDMANVVSGKFDLRFLYNIIFTIEFRGCTHV